MRILFNPGNFSGLKAGIIACPEWASVSPCIMPLAAAKSVSGKTRWQKTFFGSAQKALKFNPFASKPDLEAALRAYGEKLSPALADAIGVYANGALPAGEYPSVQTVVTTLQGKAPAGEELSYAKVYERLKRGLGYLSAWANGQTKPDKISVRKHARAGHKSQHDKFESLEALNKAIELHLAKLPEGLRIVAHYPDTENQGYRSIKAIAERCNAGNNENQLAEHTVYLRLGKALAGLKFLADGDPLPDTIKYWRPRGEKSLKPKKTYAETHTLSGRTFKIRPSITRTAIFSGPLKTNGEAAADPQTASGLFMFPNKYKSLLPEIETLFKEGKPKIKMSDLDQEWLKMHLGLQPYKTPHSLTEILAVYPKNNPLIVQESVGRSLKTVLGLLTSDLARELLQQVKSQFFDCGRAERGILVKKPVEEAASA